MASDVTMPRLSDSMEEGTVLKWLVEEGGEVKRGEPLVEIETDKANMTYDADSDGVLVEIVAQEGDTLEIGEVIARIGDEGEAKSDSGGEAKSDEDEEGGGEEAAAEGDEDEGDDEAAAESGAEDEAEGDEEAAEEEREAATAEGDEEAAAEGEAEDEGEGDESEAEGEGEEDGPPRATARRPLPRARRLPSPVPRVAAVRRRRVPGRRLVRRLRTETATGV
jgi:pyruvate dehydrogenase E2 component (dihydrolipoamide acetyltransferase)